MEDERRTSPVPKTLWSHVRTVWTRKSARRPASFYSAFAIVVVLLLGLQLGQVRDNPPRFAFVLALMFVFFFVVMARAIFDVGALIRKHFSERQQAFKATLGDKDFAAKLGERVAERQRDE